MWLKRERVVGKKKPFAKKDNLADCECMEEHEIFAVTCQSCKYNVKDFGRNYFVLPNCFSYAVYKEKSCSFCIMFKMMLYNNVNKVCVDSKIKTSSKLIPIKEYLIKKLEKSPIFIFCKFEMIKNDTKWLK